MKNYKEFDEMSAFVATFFACLAGDISMKIAGFDLALNGGEKWEILNAFCMREEHGKLVLSLPF